MLRVPELNIKNNLIQFLYVKTSKSKNAIPESGVHKEYYSDGTLSSSIKYKDFYKQLAEL